MQRHEEIVELYKYLEGNYDLSRFTFEGINFWPLIRNEARLNILFNIEPSNKWRYIKRNKNVITLLKSPIRYIKLKNAKNRFINSTGALKEELQICTYPNSLFIDSLKGKKYCRYIDPYYEVLAKKTKIGYFGILNKLEKPKDTFHEIFYLNLGAFNDYLELKKFIDSYDESKFSNYRKFEKTFDEVNDLIQSKYGIRPLHKDLIEHCIYILNHIEFFDSVFKKSNIKYLFIEDFHIYLQMSMSAAAKKNNVKVIEIQHGLFDSKYYPFINRNQIYDLLPDYIWCWSERDEKLLRSENRDFNYLKPFLGGNMWLKKFLTNEMELITMEETNFLQEIKNTFKKIILITLQPGYLLQPNMIDTIKNCPDAFLFLVRFHPLNTTDKEKQAIEETLMDFKNTEIKKASSIHLNYLLKYVDYHVTHSSASAIEALSFGVTTIVTSKSGSDFYADYIKDNVVFYSESGSEIATMIKNNVTLNPETSTRYAININENIAIDGLVKTVELSKNLFSLN